MRKALLLYNPLSGGRRARRLHEVEAAAAVLRQAGVDVEISPTQSSAGAAEQVQQAIAQGFDTVFACGGDGTIHDVLQGMVGSEVSLGIIPMGTGNTLAHDIRLPLTPVGAAQASLGYCSRKIAVGRVEYQDFSGKTASCYFTVTVGIGVDAHLFYRLNVEAKRRFGMVSYCAKATWLWMTHPLHYFHADVCSGSNTEPVKVSQLLAVRIRQFGGVLRELAPGASLERNDLRLVLFRTQSRIAYLRYILRGLAGTEWQVPGIDLKDADRVACRILPDDQSQRVFVEADGELLGTLPAKISMLPAAVNLLMP